LDNAETLNGKPVIRWAYDNCKATGFPVAFCTPVGDPVAEYCRNEGILCVEGDEENVLERYYRTARVLGWSRVARVTGDCPMISPAVVFFMCSKAQSYSLDFFTNCYPKGVDGQEVDVVSFRLLEWALKNAVSKDDKEHVTTYIKKNKLAVQKNFQWGEYSDKIFRQDRMSIDTEEDLKRISKMLKGER